MLKFRMSGVHAMSICAMILLATVLAPARGASAGNMKYRGGEVKNGGTISGTITLAGGKAAIEPMEITKDTRHCGGAKTESPRLVLGAGGGVANTVVYLEGITEGKAQPPPARHVVNQKTCEYDPHITLLARGAQLEIMNSDPILHNVHAYDGETASKTIFNIAQPVKGQRTTIKEAQLSTPGMLYLTCDAGHPWMSAYVMIADHPYYALTDEDGKFSLDNVPPGTYRVKAWHEGVNVARTQEENGKVKSYVFEEPYELEKEIEVSPGGEARADFELRLR